MGSCDPIPRIRWLLVQEVTDLWLTQDRGRRRSTLPSSNTHHGLQFISSAVWDLQATGSFFFTIGSNSRSFSSSLSHFSETQTQFPRSARQGLRPAQHETLPTPFSDGPAFINLLPMHTSSFVVTLAQGLVNVVDVSNTNTRESGLYHVRLPFSFRPLSPPTHLQLDTTFCITSIAVSSNHSYLACSRHSPSPYGSRRVIRVLFQWLSRPASGMGRRSQTTPRNRLVRSHMSQLDRYALLYEPPAFFLDTSIPLFNEPSSPTACQRYRPRSCQQSRSAITLHIPLSQRSSEVGEIMAPTQVEKWQRKVGRRRQSLQRAPQRCNSCMPQVELEHLTTMVSDEAPRIYRRVEIEYSKFGVEDFDFGYIVGRFLSPRSHSPLGSTTKLHIVVSKSTSYTSTQRRSYKRCIMLFPLESWRGRISTNCPREHCLLCEFGSVVRMLKDVHRTNCQSSNFCKMLGVLAQGRIPSIFVLNFSSKCKQAQNQLELMDYGREPTEGDYAHKIQLFHRFLIHHLSSEGNSFPHNPPTF